jgi:hypothetical protein
MLWFADSEFADWKTKELLGIKVWIL